MRKASATSARRSSRENCSRRCSRSLGDDADILTVAKKGEPLASVLSLYLERHRLSLLGRRHRGGARRAGERTALFRADETCRRTGLHPRSISAGPSSAPAPSHSRRIGASSPSLLAHWGSAGRCRSEKAAREMNSAQTRNTRPQIADWGMAAAVGRQPRLRPERSARGAAADAATSCSSPTACRSRRTGATKSARGMCWNI